MDKIICFGKNYADHMLELGDKPVEKPVIFLKPPSVLKSCDKWGETTPLLFSDDEIHYECELVFQLKNGGYQLTPDQAREALGAFTVGLDMTKRGLQSELKKAGHPWEIGKVFPNAAIIAPWLSLEDLDQVLSLEFSFWLNDQVRQKSTGSHMLYSPVDLLVMASQYFPLCPGDIVFTGTPSGVGKIQQHDEFKLFLGDNWIKGSFT